MDDISSDISSDEKESEESDNSDTDFASESQFLLKTNCSNGLYIFDEYIYQPLSFKFAFHNFPYVMV